MTRPCPTTRPAYAASSTSSPAPSRSAAQRLGFSYEGLFRHFTAELPVDADGMVRDYPGYFRRLPEPGA